MSAQSMAVSRPDELEPVSVALITDPAGKMEYPEFSKAFVAIHVGRSVYMNCQRGGQKHAGLGVHGDIDIIPPHTACIWEPKDEDTALVLGIQPALLARISDEEGHNPDRVEIRNRFQIRDRQIENIGWTLKAEMEAGYPGGRLMRESLGTALTACLLRGHSSVALPHPAPNGGMSGRRLKQVISFIEENLRHDLSLGEIAAVAGVSVTHCKVTFRESMGMPIHQYVIQRRVEAARVLLGKGTLPISQIAQETGFSHQSHLARHMRRLLGVTPQAARRLTG
jgi:AraC family transcriptional regulator